MPSRGHDRRKRIDMDGRRSRRRLYIGGIEGLVCKYVVRVLIDRVERIRLVSITEKLEVCPMTYCSPRRTRVLAAVSVGIVWLVIRLNFDDRRAFVDWGV
jgi:hypothetical protein